MFVFYHIKLSIPRNVHGEPPEILACPCPPFTRQESNESREPVLVTDHPVQVQDFRKLTHHFRGIYGIYLKLMKKTQKITTTIILEDQTHFVMPRGAKMSLALHEPIQNVISSNLHPTSTHAPQAYQTWKVL